MPVVRLLDTVPKPPRIARLPRNQVGYPIPWFVAELPDGSHDFRIADAEKRSRALVGKLCWVCGDKLGQYVAFVIGPMCAVNRISGEPPAHRDCAIYSATVCPFLSTPGMRRRPIGEELGTIPAAGEMIERNPGVALVWITKNYGWFRPTMGNDGILFEFGDPTELQWLRNGLPASRADVLAAIESGLPLLREACQRDENPADSLAYLDLQVQTAMRLVPA